MASFNKFNSFVENLAEGVTTCRRCAQGHADQLAPRQRIACSDLTEISAGNGYTAGGIAATVAVVQPGGTYKLVLDDVIITASGGSIGPFRYFVLIR